VLESGDTRYFAKTNDARTAATFLAEADGLVALADAGMRVPRPIAQGEADGSAFLVLEYLALGHGADSGFRELGRALARLHTHRGGEFGWHHDNFIGLTPQPNGRHASWTGFWQHERLAPQFALAARNGHRGELQLLGGRVIEAVPQLLAGHSPAPSLLHGDLWSGNAGFLGDGTPVVFDPAVYYGDAEADLAMTELFGGFPPSFYEGYREVRQIAAGYPVRRVLYNLYHVLNHLNLFGEGYRSQAERMMARVLSG
jgi:fructosamine-3-kinase